ncbi:Cell wall surface anchor family protein [Rhodotorula toruloides ATCC 204091]|uniref:BY PROTMAP: gi/342320910/gb/EGU12848.1/ Cell wall surface anchor family protein [Rhodotorula glutinis ATCC 204091] n=1 Tax=Rhodotorula toruloides TaxID=5286 RepID=A0A0K3CAR8_RHOTO|nr:Cell wall surface anchor family protein [Rhodotorula toruloides ATCC 204091]
MPQSYPRLPLELVERICEDATAGEYDSSVEQLGKSVSLVCREWKEVGQALAFKQPVLGRWYSDHRDDLTVLAEHLERFPHLARLVRVLKVKFGWDATDAALPPLHQLLERCRNLTEIACVAALSLRTLTLEFNGYNNQRPLRPPPSFAPIEAIFLQRFFRLIEPTTLTSLAISFHTRNFGGVSKWISTCVNLRSLVAWMQDGDLTPYTSRLTSMLGPLRSLRRLKLYGDKSVQLCENMSEREENLHAFTLAAFLDSLPTTLVMFNIAIWAPAGDCCGVVKAFLRCRLYGSPLVSASIDSAAGRWARISITATKQRLTYQDGRRRRTWSNVGEGEGTIRRAAPPSELACEPAEDPWPFAALRRERISARWLMSYRYWAGYCETCYESDDGSWELDRGQQDRSWWWRDPEKERL